MAWFLIAGSVIVLIIAIGTALYSWHFSATAAHTSGRVIEMVKHTNNKDGGVSYSPVFVFRDATGAEHTIYSTLSSWPPRHRVGDIVPILFSPDDPQNARIEGFWYLWFVPVLTGILGIIYLPVGLVVLFWPRIASRFKKPAA